METDENLRAVQTIHVQTVHGPAAAVGVEDDQ
jgi:hypothetical protein